MCIVQKTLDLIRRVAVWRLSEEPSLPWAANWSQCSLYPASNQRATSKLSAKPKNSKTFHPDEGTIATPPGFHRSTNRHHATQQNGKHHFCHAQHHRLSRYGIEDCFYSPDAQRITPIQHLSEEFLFYRSKAVVPKIVPTDP
ncbi:hypothetical protein TNCV_1214791 [Trichonephila clavipes]|nr:hypothetical protein TNCV_1214791 [Trichonephila clavipes]